MTKKVLVEKNFSFSFCPKCRRQVHYDKYRLYDNNGGLKDFILSGKCVCGFKREFSPREEHEEWAKTHKS